MRWDGCYKRVCDSVRLYSHKNHVAIDIQSNKKYINEYIHRAGEDQHTISTIQGANVSIPKSIFFSPE